jgi:tRNA-2-methylthio-N6-dimethylallyladenosine synthase
MGTSARSAFPLILEAVEQGKEALHLWEEKPVFAFSSSHHEEGRFRSFVPIMHGCNNFCSYCIVPYVRGREISRDPASIKNEIRLLAGRGVREITLLGQNVNSYRWEGNGGTLEFPDLLELIARETVGTPIGWVRFLSANPKDFSLRTIAVMAENPVFCRHLHLCVQHGSDRVLAAMNRRYTRESYLDLTREIRKAMPDLSFSTDILVGFPGETEADLEETLSLMEEVRFLYAYMYHYNPREGTAAFNLSGRIPEAVKRERLSRVIALQKKHTREMLKSRLGMKEKVLIEGISRKNADELITRTEKDEMAAVPGSPALIGSFAELTLSSLRGNTFRAKEFRLCPGD